MIILRAIVRSIIHLDWSQHLSEAVSTPFTTVAYTSILVDNYRSQTRPFMTVSRSCLTAAIRSTVSILASSFLALFVEVDLAIALMLQAIAKAHATRPHVPDQVLWMSFWANF